MRRVSADDFDGVLNADLGARLQGLLLVLGLLVVWEAVSRTALLDPAYLPPPSTVLLAWRELVARGELAEHVGTTLRVWMQGFALAALVGVSLGLLMGLFRPLAATLATTVELLRPMPSVAIIPIAIVSFGLDDPMKRFVTMYAATWPILINTLYGVRSVEPTLIDAARTFRFSGARRALTVVLPAALPQITAGLRTALAIALIVTLVSEMVATTRGLGFFIVLSQRSFRMADMYAGILVLAILGYALNRGFLVLESRLIAWHPAHAGRVE